MRIIADSHIPFINEYFGAYGDLILKAGRSISPEDVKNADILLVRSITHVDEALLKGSSVKFVGSVTAGADHLDTKWMDEAGIAWSVATGFNAPPVADYVMSCIAALQRKHLLPNEKPFRAGVIGVGNVGNLVADRLRLLNCDIVQSDPVRASHEASFPHVPLEDMCDLDFITIHVPLTKGGEHPTYHFIDKAFLARQRKGCVLLNASRGSVIDSTALMAHGTHLNWCFDVWANEPRINKDILQRAIIGTPHIAGYSIQSKIRGIDMIYKIACEKQIIQPQDRSPIIFPHQEISFAGETHHWQDIVMGIFNPLILTAMLRTLILPENDYGHLFDDMRHQFNYRHEFGFTHVTAHGLLQHDQQILQSLGVTL